LDAGNDDLTMRSGATGVQKAPVRANREPYGIISAISRHKIYKSATNMNPDRHRRKPLNGSDSRPKICNSAVDTAI
jgi:hypothetical protein